MADFADDAQAREAQFLAQALDRAKPTFGPAPDIVDGVACCAECGEPIPAARLAALPGAGLDGQILALEATVTQRRLRDAALTEAGKAWLAGVDAQIAALRAQRV